jgi:hypothetical protein
MIKQNPFSVYDFLGYFIPGALTIYILLLSDGTKLNSVHDIIDVVSKNNEFQLDQLLLFIIASYSLGHLINFCSSITIEKYSIWKYNYPSKYLMDLKPNHKYWEGKCYILAIKIVMIIIIFPVVVFDYLFGDLFKFKRFYTSNMDKYLIKAIKLKGLILLKKLGLPKVKKLGDYDFHRIFSHYVYENSKNHQAKLTNYVALYGFLRSLCFLSVLFIWQILYVNLGVTSGEKLSCVLLILSLMSYIFFMAFMKFYRRYSLESLMLIIVDKDLVEPETNI